MPPTAALQVVRLKGFGVFAPDDVQFSQFPSTLGRGDDADIPISDRFSSRVHCEFSMRDDVLFIQDADSANGTLVNGEPIADIVPLQTGDTVTIGASSYYVAIESNV